MTSTVTVFNNLLLSNLQAFTYISVEAIGTESGSPDPVTAESPITPVAPPSPEQDQFFQLPGMGTFTFDVDDLEGVTGLNLKIWTQADEPGSGTPTTYAVPFMLDSTVGVNDPVPFTDLFMAASSANGGSSCWALFAENDAGQKVAQQGQYYPPPE